MPDAVTESVSIHLRRIGFDPPPEVVGHRIDGDVPRVRTPFGDEAWLITRYADVREVLSDHERFSNVPPKPFDAPEGMTEEEANAGAGAMLLLDPPDHTRLRRLLTPEFTVRRMSRLDDRVREIVDDHLEAMARSGPPVDFVERFALPVPSLVMSELLGVPYEDRAEFQDRAARQTDLTLGVDERVRVAAESRAYMAELVDRALADPGDDLLGTLAQRGGDDDLTRAELAGVGSLLLVAGHETTAHMLALGTLALLTVPSAKEAVRDDPEAVGPAVEELMRYLSVIHSGIPRRVLTDTVVGGHEFAAGDLIVVSFPAANRDPELLADGDELDVSRRPTVHLGFGHGVHHCLGAPLARKEMAVAFPALLRRFPDLELAVGFDEIEFRDATVTHGVVALPVRW